VGEITMTEETNHDSNSDLFELIAVFKEKRDQAKARKEEIENQLLELRREYSKLDEEISLFASAVEKIRQEARKESQLIPEQTL
jgi:predicted  nucleic acid-binding Zn-ribbon protein